MNWFKRIFHKCGYYRWEAGYGLTPYGTGGYEYKVCRECGKTGDKIFNFVLDKSPNPVFKKLSS